MKFFKDNYELDKSIPMDQDGDEYIVISMENEF